MPLQVVEVRTGKLAVLQQRHMSITLTAGYMMLHLPLLLLLRQQMMADSLTWQPNKLYAHVQSFQADWDYSNQHMVAAVR